jgi:preprotein translocase subunit SecG
MFGIILALHVLVCICLVFIVLIQQSKGAGISSVFGGGGGGGESVFGGRGAAPFLIKATTGLAVGFMLTSLILTIVSARSGGERPAVEKLIEQPSPQPNLPIPTLPESTVAPPESTQ